MHNKHINLIKIRTKILSKKLFSGNFLSKFSGDGLSFKEIREYDASDDSKTID